MSAWEVVIGLEVHVQLLTRTKLFCACSAAYGAAPNTQICEVCSGQPGAMPSLNREAVVLALRLARALGATISETSRFARKSYFYPDLPKGYQISQYDEPLATGGAVEIELSRGGRALRERVALTRLHLEEDAGRLIHGEDDGLTRIDLNRAGVPLVEIVSEPVLRSPEAAAIYLRTLRGIVRTLGISDGNLEEGSLRCDANVSLRPVGSSHLGTRTELKNLNSFRFVERALDAEIVRQRALLDGGRVVTQETRSWDPRRGETLPSRRKEAAEDYRYLLEPDLPPLVLDPAWIQAIDAALPELPLARRDRLVDAHGGEGLTRGLADTLCRDGEIAEVFERLVDGGVSPRTAATWTTTELLARLGDPRDALEVAISPEVTAELLRLVDARRLSRRQAKILWDEIWADPSRVVAGIEALARDRGMLDDVVTAGAIDEVVRALVAAHPQEVATYRSGRVKLLGWFVGKALSKLGAGADAAQVSERLRDALSDP